MKVLQVLVKVFASFLLSITFLIFVIQEDPWCKQMVEAHVTAFFKDCHSNFHCRVTSFNVLGLKVTLEHIVCSPTHEDEHWFYGCKKYTMQGSWWKVLTHNTIEMSSVVEDLSIFSEVEGSNLAIYDHLEALLGAPLIIPITLESLSVRHGSVHVHDVIRQADMIVGCNTVTMLSGNKCKTSISLTHIDVIGPNTKKYISQVGGNVECNIIDRPSGIDVQARAHLLFKVPFLSEEESGFTLSASWKDNRGYFDMHNDDYMLGGSIAKVGQSLVLQARSTMPISYIEAFLQPGSSSQRTSGLMTVDIHADLFDFDNFAHIQCALENPAIYGYSCEKVIGEIERKDAAYQGTYMIKKGDSSVSGDIIFNEQSNTGSFMCTGKIGEILPYIMQSQFTLSIDSSDGEFHGLCTLESIEDKPHVYIHTEAHGSPNDIVINGECNNKFFTMYFVKDSSECIHVKCLNELQEKLLDVMVCTTDIKGMVDVRLFITGLDCITDIDVHGEGILTFESKITPSDISGGVEFSQGTIRIPMIYNGIRGLTSTFKFLKDDMDLHIHNTKINLHKGSISFDEIMLGWNEHGDLNTLNMLFNFQQCFLSHHKDFFAILSGSGVIQKRDKSFDLNGAISIDRSHLKGNVLAGRIENDILSASSNRFGYNLDNVNIDISVMTKEPMKVRTSFLQTNAMINAVMKGAISALTGSGSIELRGGSLSFPYKPLYITSGKMVLMPHQLDDPVIELQAKNTIKKYNISVLISGTVKKPKIIFSSSPTLSEEQIITLLCTGSEDTGLLSAVPSVIMHNIQQLLFGPADEASSFSKVVKKFLRPFDNIRVVPTIGTNKDRSGLQACVEVDIHDRLRGSVRKNLNTAEDTEVELEYTLSDEMSIRGKKDERGDLSAELEVRLTI